MYWLSWDCRRPGRRGFWMAMVSWHIRHCTLDETWLVTLMVFRKTKRWLSWDMNGMGIMIWMGNEWDMNYDLNGEWLGYEWDMNYDMNYDLNGEWMGYEWDMNHDMNGMWIMIWIMIWMGNEWDMNYDLNGEWMGYEWDMNYDLTGIWMGYELWFEWGMNGEWMGYELWFEWGMIGIWMGYELWYEWGMIGIWTALIMLQHDLYTDEISNLMIYICRGNLGNNYGKTTCILQPFSQGLWIIHSESHDGCRWHGVTITSIFTILWPVVKKSWFVDVNHARNMAWR